MAIQDEIPRSRLTLTYKTNIDGQLADIELPLRILVLGDFSRGTSVDRKTDLDERRLRSIDGANLDPLMSDMKMSLSFRVPNRIDPDRQESLDVQLPITRMRSFSPDEIAQHVPRIRALLLMKTLLSEIQSDVDNRKELRKLVQEIFSSPEAMQAVLAELEGYESFRLPASRKADQPAV